MSFVCFVIVKNNQINPSGKNLKTPAKHLDVQIFQIDLDHMSHDLWPFWNQNADIHWHKDTDTPQKYAFYETESYKELPVNVSDLFTSFSNALHVFMKHQESRMQLNMNLVQMQDSSSTFLGKWTQDGPTGSLFIIAGKAALCRTCCQVILRKEALKMKQWPSVMCLKRKK